MHLDEPAPAEDEDRWVPGMARFDEGVVQFRATGRSSREQGSCRAFSWSWRRPGGRPFLPVAISLRGEEGFPREDDPSFSRTHQPRYPDIL